MPEPQRQRGQLFVPFAQTLRGGGGARAQRAPFFDINACVLFICELKLKQMFVSNLA